MTPKKRVMFIDNKFQKDLEKIKTKLNGLEFELVGTKKRPRGIKIGSGERIVKSLVKLPYINPLLTTGLSKKIKRTKEDSYFCFKTIFQIQIEGQEKGLQTIEERFILVKADNWDKAEAKVIKGFKNREEPYLNVKGQLVRWKFESIEESYHTFVESKDEFDNPVEVFSKLKTRRLRKEHVWHGE